MELPLTEEKLIRKPGIGIYEADSREKDNEFDFGHVRFEISIGRVPKGKGNSELELRSNIWVGDKHLESMGEVSQVSCV